MLPYQNFCIVMTKQKFINHKRPIEEYYEIAMILERVIKHLIQNLGLQNCPTITVIMLQFK